MARQIELNPVSHLTVGTIGVPGKRTFYLQGSRGTQTVTLTIEKEQALMMASSFESLLQDLQKKTPQPSGETEEPVWMDMRLREPVTGLFRVGNMGVGYNESTDQIVLVAYELVEEDEEPSVVSFWASRQQIQALIQHAKEVVSAGRPICGNCGRPIDPEGHFCPNRNGHLH
ncbi:MAG: DUF3090 domain-containing protein [Ardenticatenaceae bacterium]|nr:DUF3090 domain-containing protein [Anaerolineales bacterium]MCB8923077.1 DUF3090 domain-containing protein [Ardenticatenaceae bacterium]MCB8992058.1 DUF3090 domain-containing protein [Ardenticatenaceae bacterium]